MKAAPWLTMDFQERGDFNDVPGFDRGYGGRRMIRRPTSLGDR